ncbi:MAG: phosphatidylglycerophosphatase A [Alphaproteobacteria bacterium]|nr:phosphatidylglycerophosphatase A [Alphaproteobacteria bacterium]
MASGTWGSLAALPFGWILQAQGGSLALLLAAAVATVAGTLASNRLLAHGGDQDPGYIVIDEIAAQWLALAFAPPSWWGYLIAFAAFRAADIVKPFPANWCDRNVHGGLGVMLDDLVAGLYAGIATWLACRHLPIERYLHALGF